MLLTMEGDSVSLNEYVVKKAVESDRLECKQCSRRFVYEKSLLNHIAEHATPTSNMCHVCGKSFDKRNYQRHMATHSNVRKYHCDLCFASFKSWSNLQAHRLVHSDFDKVGFKCTVCDKIFQQKMYLLRHLRIHTPENYERIQCRKCGAHVRKMYYNKHLRWHSMKRKYACSVCNKKFKSLSTLNLHYNIHTGDTHYECEICDYKTSHKHNFIAHISKHSSETQIHKCSKCQKVYKRPNHLKRHLKLHENSKPYRCLRCERAFATSYWLRIHEQTHSVTDKQHHCNQCQRSFLTIQHLNRHSRCHKKPFVCGVCSHSFHCKKDLTRHMKIHLNGNFCQICNKSFHNLPNHTAKHKRQREYKCQECNFVSSNLKTYKDTCKHIQEKLPRCHLCRRIFLTENGLNLHVKRYQNRDMKCYHSTKPRPKAAKKINKPKPRSKCQECKREFSDINSYRQHMESHDPNKQFCCEYCHERFYSFTKLYKHLGKHNG